MGRFIQLHYPKIYSNPTAYNKEVRSLVQSNIKHSESKGNGRYRLPGDSAWLTYSFAHKNTDTWNCDAEKDRLLRYVDYPDCFVTRMAYIETGAFWDQNLYSPHNDGKKHLIPIKKHLDANKYGGYSEKQYAFFFVYASPNSRSTKKYQLSGVPIAKLAVVVNSTTGKIDKKRLIQLEEQLVAARGASIQILQPIIYKNQVIEFGERREIITGLEVRKNAKELAFKQQHMRLLKKWNNHIQEEGPKTTEVVDEDAQLNEMFDLILEKTAHCAPALHNKLLNIVGADVDNYALIEQKFAAISDKDTKKRVLFGIISIANTNTNPNKNVKKWKTDLTVIGVNKGFERIRDWPEQFDIIEQSVTGMFEKRIHIGV